MSFSKRLPWCVLRRIAAVGCLLPLLWARPGSAQFADAIDARTLSTVLTNLFGTNTAFSSVADIELTTELSGRRLKLTAGCCRLDGSFRIYVDTDKLEGLKMPGLAKRTGLGRVVNVVRPDKGAMFEIFPDAQSYIEKRIPAGPAEIKEAFQNLERKFLGEEVVARHPCRKYGLVAKQGNESAQIGTIWVASDLRDFPVQVRVGGDDDKSPIMIQFKDIKFVRLQAALFEVPTSFQRYAGIAELYEARAKRDPALGK
jgi:hypothetical protein